MGVGTMRTLVAAAVITLALVGHAAAQGGARELQQSSSTCSPGRVDKYFYLEIGAATCNFYRPGAYRSGSCEVTAMAQPRRLGCVSGRGEE